MRDGRIVQDSSPFELYRHPASLFAATFVGEANAWPGRVVESAETGDACTVAVDGLSDLRGRASTPLRQGQEAVYVVRPDRVDATTDDAALATVDVSDVLARGPRALVLGRVSGGPLVRVELAAREAEKLGPGGQLALAWSADEALVFPSQQGSQSAIRP
jgi:ABC-type Fe3+/spermidine/putrescine transport system ATPase subunit